MDEVGIVCRLWGEAAPLVCHQLRAPLLRVDGGEHRGRDARRGACVRGRALEEGAVARRLLGDLAYRSRTLREELADSGVLLATEKADRRAPIRQQVEVCFAALKRWFGMGGTLARTLTGLVTRIAAKVAAYTYGCYVNRLLGRPQGRIKELWA
jgi:hypothetical protein